MPWLLAMAIGLIALILTPGVLFYFDVTPKVAVLLAATAIALPFVRVRKHFGLVLLYALWIAVSASLSTNPAISWFGGNWRRYGAVTQIAVLLFAWSIGSARTTLRAIAIATTLAAIYGILQFAGFDPILPAGAYHIGEGIWTIVRPPATFGYVSYYATWLVIASFLAMALAGAEDGAWKWIGYVTAGLAVVAMLLTGTRAAVLALVAGGAVRLYRRRAEQHPGAPLRSRLGLAAAGLALIAGGFYFSPAGTQLRSRTRWFVEDPWGGARLALWRDSLRMSLHRPLQGFGPEVFTAEFPHYESEQLARAYPDFAHESPHNIFLDALVSQGIPGLILLAALLVTGLRAAGNPFITAALAAGIVSQQFTVFTIPTALLTFIAAALAFPEPEPRRRPALILAPVSIALLYCAVRYTAADFALARAQHALASSDFRTADTHYAAYTRWRFPGGSADLWYSHSLFELARRTSDVKAIVRSGTAAVDATRTSEDPFNAWYNVAQLAAARNDPAGTERALRAAIATHPNWFKPHWTLAQLLQLENRRAEAVSEATLANQLDAGKNPEVARTLDAIQR